MLYGEKFYGSYITSIYPTLLFERQEKGKKTRLFFSYDTKPLREKKAVLFAKILFLPQIIFPPLKNSGKLTITVVRLRTKRWGLLNLVSTLPITVVRLRTKRWGLLNLVNTFLITVVRFMLSLCLFVFSLWLWFRVLFLLFRRLVLQFAETDCWNNGCAGKIEKTREEKLQAVFAPFFPHHSQRDCCVGGNLSSPPFCRTLKKNGQQTGLFSGGGTWKLSFLSFFWETGFGFAVFWGSETLL